MGSINSLSISLNNHLNSMYMELCLKVTEKEDLKDSIMKMLLSVIHEDDLDASHQTLGCSEGLQKSMEQYRSENRIESAVE